MRDFSLILVGVYYVLSALSPKIMLNFGTTRPFTCILPEGSVLNPAFPAAVGMRSLTCARLRSLVFGHRDARMTFVISHGNLVQIHAERIQAAGPERASITSEDAAVRLMRDAGITQMPLVHGCEIKIGSTTMRFLTQ